jgi:hypothetical protein
VPADYRQFPLLVVDDEPDILKSFRFNYGDEFEIVTAEASHGRRRATIPRSSSPTSACRP